MQLTDKIAFITGADSGIGQAAAETFAGAGADVAIAYHTDEAGAERTKRLVEGAGRRAFVARCDVTDPASVDDFFDDAAQALGAPDILMANAGTGMGGMEVADMADYCTGQVFVMDGGLTMNWGGA